MHILLLLDHTRKFMPAERLSWRHGCHIFFNDRSPKHVKSKLSPNVIWWQRVVQEQVTIIAKPMNMNMNLFNHNNNSAGDYVQLHTFVSAE